MDLSQDKDKTVNGRSAMTPDKISLVRPSDDTVPAKHKMCDLHFPPKSMLPTEIIEKILQEMLRDETMVNLKDCMANNSNNDSQPMRQDEEPEAYFEVQTILEPGTDHPELFAKNDNLRLLALRAFTKANVFLITDTIGRRSFCEFLQYINRLAKQPGLGEHLVQEVTVLCHDGAKPNLQAMNGLLLLSTGVFLGPYPWSKTLLGLQHFNLSITVDNFNLSCKYGHDPSWQAIKSNYAAEFERAGFFTHPSLRSITIIVRYPVKTGLDFILGNPSMVTPLIAKMNEICEMLEGMFEEGKKMVSIRWKWNDRLHSMEAAFEDFVSHYVGNSA